MNGGNRVVLVNGRNNITIVTSIKFVLLLGFYHIVI